MPMLPGYGYGHGMSRFGMRTHRGYPSETKPFFLTSEFIVCLVAAVAITGASSEAFGAWRAWELISLIVVAYPLSRGLAKSGTRSHTPDPRDHLDLHMGRGDHHEAPQRWVVGQHE